MVAKRALLVVAVAAAVAPSVTILPGTATLEQIQGLGSALAASQVYRFGEEIQVSLPADVAAERRRPAVAYNYVRGEYLVVWHNIWPGGGRDIYARRVSDTGQLRSWFTVTAGAGKRFQPAVAYNALNDQYLVVWMQEASPNVYEIWGKIIPWNGPGTNSEFVISQWANRSFWTPKVAWSSLHNEYLVLCNGYDTTVSFPPGLPNDVGGHRVSATGVVDPGPGPVATYAYPHQVDLTYNVAMDEYFAVFVVVHTQQTTGNDVYGLRMSWQGVPVNPPGLIEVATQAGNQNAPAVATDEQGRYMVTWEHEYSSTDHDIYAREYNVLGSPVGSYWGIASWTEDTTAPDVAANGSHSEWLVVWQQDLGSGSGHAVKGFRWGSGLGVATYLLEIANYAYWHNQSPAVAADLPGYFVVYEGEGPDPAAERHIYGRMWWPEAMFLPVTLRTAP